MSAMASAAVWLLVGSVAWLPVELEEPATGSRVELAAGAPVLHVVLFATWCPPCVDELDDLAELEARWGERGYRLVLVAVSTRHTPSKLARFAEQRRTPGRLLLDADGTLEAALDGAGLPTHLLIDAAGREVSRASALDARVKQQVERLIRQGSGPKGR